MRKSSRKGKYRHAFPTRLLRRHGQQMWVKKKSNKWKGKYRKGKYF